jgi:DNA repair exonuclease SbcCD ATPase subunit
METDEILKRLEFLDAERRKDKKLIADLQEQIASLQEGINAGKREIQHLNSEIKKSTVNLVRYEEYEETLSNLKVELMKVISDTDKKITSLEKDTTSHRKEDKDTFNFRLLELQNELISVNEIKKEIQAKLDNDFVINQRIDDIAKLLPGLQSKDSELEHEIKLVENNYRSESKRISDLTVDFTALRKTIENERTTLDSQREYIKKMDGQINDLANREKLRHQEQVAFIEAQSRQAIDKDNFIKEWQEKVLFIQTIGANVQSKMLELQEASRLLKNSQSDFEEMNQRLDRRLNELTEMNRLMEERFRQEWTAFKADDQKRWTNYSLSQEESVREGDREMLRLTDRITSLEDTAQNLLDLVHVINDETEKRIKGLLTLANENLGSFERSIGKKS